MKMAELISKKNMSSWTDGILIGISKVATENLLKPIVGDSSLISGGIKLFGGSMIASTKQLGKIGSIVGQGMQIDGVEDIALVIINKTNGLFGLLPSAKPKEQTSTTLI